MKEKIKVGYIGLGGRGLNVLQENFIKMEDVEIKYLCDVLESRMQLAVELFEKDGLPIPITTTCSDDIMNDPEVDAVVIMTGWNTHIDLAKKSMLAGKYTAIEVGCAYDLQECFDLIDIYEQTKSPLMMLENCCYGRNEMMALRLVKEGIFGEIVHCRGGYRHYLPSEDLFPERAYNHYRAHEYVNRNCEQYPTHELGPICKCLNINRGNRLMKLTSTASKSRALKDYVTRYLPEDSEFQNVEFKQGDIVNTIITCANGETILLTLDTTLPIPYYSRDFTVRGTKGCFEEDRFTVFLEGQTEDFLLYPGMKADEVFNKKQEKDFALYDHPLWAEYVKTEMRGGHGGFDWLVCRAFVESVKRGIETPIDAYDTVTLMAIAPLSEMSIQKGGMPVSIPDFTRGKWIRREPPLQTKYSLDEIVTDPDTPI
ncbi:MAG: Gfo/Idh/MocA family oxidoreductase [Oscillospiraceae bacterium]|nr:Gfo/Idh/MocA family oxidoreductase [Oscillospiraceae bacterium]